MHRMTRRQCCGGLLAFGALAAAGCVSASGQRSGEAPRPSERERALGREAAEEVERTSGLVDDAPLVAYIREVGQRLTGRPDAQAFGWTFNIVDDEEPNAFALPGGYVYVSRGLLALLNSEDELAGIMGHEIGHVVARHSVRRATAATPFGVLFGIPAAVVGAVSPSLGGVVAGVGKLAGGVVLSPYSREQEREADQLGMEFAAAAGWNPRGLSSALRTLARADALSGHDPSRTSFLSTHPAPAERAGDTERAAGALSRGSGAPISGTRGAFVGRLEGLVVGPNPANGIFVDRQFLHPDLGFAWEVPQAWKTRNTPEAAGASEAQGRAVALLQMVTEGGDPMAGARADQLPPELLRRLEPSRIAGLPAARVIADSRGARLDLTWIAYAGRVYRIAGMSRVADFEQFRPAFADTARSFRPMADADRRRVVVDELRIQAARDGESLPALIRRTGAAWDPEHTAVANGIEPGSRLEAGWPVKVPIRRSYAGRRTMAIAASCASTSASGETGE